MLYNSKRLKYHIYIDIIFHHKEPVGTSHRSRTGCIVDLVAQIKEYVDVSLIVVQRIIDPMQAEKILEDGKADIVCFGRALICDPD